MNIAAILAELVKIGPLIEQAIPALEEGAHLLGTALPGAGVQPLLTAAEGLLAKAGPLGQALNLFIQAIEAHKAAAAAAQAPTA